jgi:hypothetical protein
MKATAPSAADRFESPSAPVELRADSLMPFESPLPPGKDNDGY